MPEMDSDGDGVCDSVDQCSGTPGGEPANAEGCSCSQIECNDGNPCTFDSCAAGVCVHTVQDADGDGVCDAVDNCPNVPNAGQQDSNGDGVGDACTAASGIIGNVPGNPDSPDASHGVDGQSDEPLLDEQSEQAKHEYLRLFLSALFGVPICANGVVSALLPIFLGMATFRRTLRRRRKS
jgi:hypothetical protein